MDTSDKNTSPFEQQLQQSAHRLRDQQNYDLPMRKNPRQRFAWGWITTAAAAVIGWYVGISFPLNDTLTDPTVALAVPADTIIQYREKIVRDTVIQKIEIPTVRKQKITATSSQPSHPTQGCNMECDGIDYSLLIGM